MLKDVVWITWEKQIRNQSMASCLQVELFEIIISSNRLSRYLKSFILTRNVIRSRLPKVVVAPNPSIVLAYALLFLRGIYKFSLITDAHYLGVRTLTNIPFLQFALDNYNKRVDLAIVTNNAHADYIQSLGGKPFICQDPLPLLPEAAEIDSVNLEKSIFFICSFDVDEPYEEVFRAYVKLKGLGYSLLVSGNYKKAKIDVTRYPDINFLGFIPANKFYGFLKQCSVVLDLTTCENCLVCGAYEALSAGKPAVVSDTKALKAYFDPAVVFTDNSPDAIADKIVYAYEYREQLSVNIGNWVKQNKKETLSRIKELRLLILSIKR